METVKPVSYRQVYIEESIHAKIVRFGDMIVSKHIYPSSIIEIATFPQVVDVKLWIIVYM